MNTDVKPAAGALGLSIATGAAWMVALRLVHRFAGMFSLAVLARLLNPADFGLIALAMTVAGFLELFGQTHVDVALIRDQGADRDRYNSAWTFELLRAVAVAVLLVVVAAPVSVFFSEPRLQAVLYAVAGIQIIGSLQNIGIVDFRKSLRFEREFLFEISSRIAGVALTIAAAFILRSHWALVVGIALQNCSRVLLSYVMSRYRPSLCFARLREIFHFSKWMVAQNLFYGLRDQAPVFVVSRLLSLEILGLFNLAREISALVTSELRAPIRRVLYPGFARMPVEGGLLRSGYIDAFAILLLLSLPLSVGLYTLAPLLVEVVLGPRWLPAVPLLEVLALLGIVQSFGANTYLVINRIGKPMWNAAGGGVQLILFVPALVWATVRFGAIGAAWTIVAATAFMLLAEYFIMRRVLHVRICDMAAHAWRPVIGAGFMTMVMLIARRSAPAPGGALGAVLMLAVGVALGAMVYGGTVFAAWRWSGAGPGAERQIINALGQLWMPRRPFGGQF